MRDPTPHLVPGDFPPVVREVPPHTLQVNLGYRCNQSCRHCHVAAGPRRKEVMSARTLSRVIRLLERGGFEMLDITGGAPELNPGFRRLVEAAAALGVSVMDRCNLTVLLEPGQEELAAFLARHRVHLVASLPCYLEENVDRQRGNGVFARSLDALRRLNALGYGEPDSGLVLDLVFNPQGEELPPPQCALESDYKARLEAGHGIRFNRLLSLTNMPVGRFGSRLLAAGTLGDYLTRLKAAHRTENLRAVMCRTLVSVDWRGRLYDCDFNQMLGLPLGGDAFHVDDLDPRSLEGRIVAVGNHCYGCTAGQGSSCTGALS